MIRKFLFFLGGGGSQFAVNFWIASAAVVLFAWTVTNDVRIPKNCTEIPYRFQRVRRARTTAAACYLQIHSKLDAAAQIKKYKIPHKA